jgi:hypothetical protein
MVNKLKKTIAGLGLAGALTLFPTMQSWAGASGHEILSAFQEKQPTTQQVVEEPKKTQVAKDKLIIPFNVKKGSSAHNAYQSNPQVANLIDKHRGNQDGKLSLNESKKFAQAKNPFKKGHNNLPIAGSNRLVYNPRTNQLGVLPGVQPIKTQYELPKKPQTIQISTISKDDTKILAEKIDLKIQEIGKEVKKNILYLPQNFNGHISKIEKNPNGNLLVYDSTTIHQDELLFNKAIQRKNDSVLLDFIASGLYRPNMEGQTQLVNSYMKAIHDANLNNMSHENVGISALNFSDLEKMLGQDILYEDQKIQLNPQLLKDAMTYHAIHESVARHFYENQNLDNGYLVDVTPLIERNKLRGFLADNALARIVFPINTILQGKTTRYDYTQHDLTDNGVNTTQAIMNQKIDANLSNFENQIYTIINQQLGGNKQ